MFLCLFCVLLLLHFTAVIFMQLYNYFFSTFLIHILQQETVKKAGCFASMSMRSCDDIAHRSLETKEIDTYSINRLKDSYTLHTSVIAFEKCVRD